MWTYIVVEKSKVCAIHKVLRISIKLEGTDSTDHEMVCKKIRKMSWLWCVSKKRKNNSSTKVLPYLVSVLQQFNSRTRFGSQTGGTFGKLYSKSLLLGRL